MAGRKGELMFAFSSGWYEQLFGSGIDRIGDRADWILDISIIRSSPI
jgi:hypothetical protein